jgi:heat shock protein HtpX
VSTIAAAIAAAVSYLANALSFATLFGGSQEEEEGEGGAANGLLMVFLAPFLAMLIQLGISRAREYLADETGAEISGDPEALARALEKLERGAEVIPAAVPQPATASLFIVNPLSGGSRLLALLSTHPPMDERIRRLRALRPRWQRVAA